MRGIVPGDLAHRSELIALYEVGRSLCRLEEYKLPFLGPEIPNDIPVCIFLQESTRYHAMIMGSHLIMSTVIGWYSSNGNYSEARAHQYIHVLTYQVTEDV